MILGCGSNQFRCDNGKCIPLNYMGDGYKDCGDNSDESKQIIKYKINFALNLKNKNTQS